MPSLIVKNDRQYTDLIAVTGILLLFIGFLFNRVVSNTGFLLIGVYTLIHLSKVKWLFKDKWMYSFILLALLPLLSDIILQGTDSIHQRSLMKFLLILFPAFIFVYNPDRKSIHTIIYLFIILMLISSCFSLFHYFSDLDQMAAKYKVSKVIHVLSFRDHIRISWATVISCLLAFYLILTVKQKRLSWFLSVYIIFQIVFLHILGAKTGLICLYLTIIILSWYLFKGRSRLILLFIIPIVLALPVIAYKTIPSLEQRFNFIKYDFEHYMRNEYREGLSDAVRYFSLKAGMQIIREHPVTGVGFSQLQQETNLWYKKNVPAMTEQNYFLPSSQIVIYWAACGILGLIVFLWHVLLPYFTIYLKNHIWFMSFFIPTSCSFVFETHMEGQLPLFLYGFFVSWFWFLAYQDRNLNENISV